MIKIGLIQGGKIFTPCQTPRFYPLPPLEQSRYDFCGKSRVRDASGKVTVQAEGNQTDFCTVVSVDVQSRDDSKEIEKIEIKNRYLSSDYYIVQPPLMAKIFQFYFYSGLQGVYEMRRKNHQSKSVSPE
ncbi:hypothetical protein JW935_04090 [candidate division KSB1 bacterium]|nr:hypothetical protein [candidate division KSB1 bacterium]